MIDADTKSILRDAGALAGQRQREKRGDRKDLSDAVVIQRCADLLRKVGERHDDQ